MADGVFVAVDGRMKVLRRTSHDDVAMLSSLMEEHPRLIAVAAGKDELQRLLLVRRRMGAGRSTAGPTGCLYVDTEATPVLVEVLSATEATSPREVLGRLLECVAAGGPDWQGWRLREVFSLTHVGRDDATLLADTLGWQGDPDVFWAEAEANLAHHRVRLVLVADRLSDTLLGMIDFLNDQMRDVETFGVEVAVYGSGSTRAFVPRAQTGGGADSSADGRHRRPT